MGKRLLPAAAGPPGLEADLLQALREIRPGLAVARAPRAASAHGVVRQRLRVGQKSRRRDTRDGLSSAAAGAIARASTDGDGEATAHDGLLLGLGFHDIAAGE